MSTDIVPPVTVPDSPAVAPAPNRAGDRGQRGPRRDGNGPRGPRRDDRNKPTLSADGTAMIEKVVFINRCAKVVKGGRRFSFSALAVVGDGKGKIGIGYGKANEVPDAIKKGTANAHKHMVSVKLKGDTISHDVFGQYDGGRVLLKPASPGTGLIAGGGVRAVLEAAGVKNVLTKSMGSSNHIAVVNATLAALQQLRSGDEITEMDLSEFNSTSGFDEPHIGNTIEPQPLRVVSDAESISASATDRFSRMESGLRLPPLGLVTHADHTTSRGQTVSGLVPASATSNGPRGAMLTGQIEFEPASRSTETLSRPSRNLGLR